jgi:uncharacterized protein YndB with AHSA1/START domain
MPDILHSFPIASTIAQVFELLTRSESLNAWWTLGAQSEPVVGSIY